MRKILFICTGNYYRSKFAEIYFNYISHTLISYKAQSRGINIENPLNIGFISPYTVLRLNKLEIPIPKLKPPILLTENDLITSEIVIALDEKEHFEYLNETYPIHQNKITYWNIPDLYKESAETALDKLQIEVINLFVSLLNI